MKIEWKVFHRRDAEHAEMIDLFSLPLRRRQRKIVMPFGQSLISSDSLREALGLSLFCRPPPRGMGGAYSFGVSRKGKNVFLCDLCASSEAGGEI
jgi:hypothetical protein